MSETSISEQRVVLSRQEDNMEISSTFDKAVEQAKHMASGRDFWIDKGQYGKENCFFIEKRGKSSSPDSMDHVSSSFGGT